MLRSTTKRLGTPARQCELLTPLRFEGPTPHLGQYSACKMAISSFSNTELYLMCYSGRVSEQQEVIEQLRSQGVLGAIRWAFVAAADRALSDYSEDAGYDLTWLGNTRYTLFRDRLDRVFSCGRYALSGDTSADVGVDLVNVELTKKDIDAMPHLPTNLVRRADMDHSPGWTVGNLRFLLASSNFGGIETVPWPRKSRTKQRVAQQRTLEPEPTLFEVSGGSESDAAETVLGSDIEVTTFVVAHSLDAVSGRRELVLGRPRFNRGGGSAWFWQENLLAEPPAPGGRRPNAPYPSGPDDVPDAIVRLRRSAVIPQVGEGQ